MGTTAAGPVIASDEAGWPELNAGRPFPTLCTLVPLLLNCAPLPEPPLPEFDIIILVRSCCPTSPNGALNCPFDGPGPGPGPGAEPPPLWGRWEEPVRQEMLPDLLLAPNLAPSAPDLVQHLPRNNYISKRPWELLIPNHVSHLHQ